MWWLDVRAFFLLLAVIGLTKAEVASVVWNSSSKSFDIHDALVPGAVAWANFTEKINSTGWSYLSVWTNESYADEVQAYSAGLVEGYITDQLIYNHWINTVEGYCNQEVAYCQRLSDFLTENRAWMKQQISTCESNDPYWHQVNLLLAQLEGMEDGYQKRVVERRSLPILGGGEAKFGFILIQISGDLEDLEQVLNKSQVRRVKGSGSCSGLVKILPNNDDIFVSQDTWSTYQSMLRILKHYHFKYHMTSAKGSSLISGVNMTFSSYPASLTSGDDFYLVSSGLVTMETTIGNSNASLWKYVGPKSVLEWMRSMVANRLATSGSQWTKYLFQFNSGTYNNQWMVVDMKLFKRNQPLKDNLLWVAEQIPKYVQSADLTDVLRRQNYWPSYNTPYFPLIYNMSGAAAQAAKYGDLFSYDRAPRALIFKRDQSKVTDLSTMIKLMRYNDYTHDPLSRCNCTPPYSAENAISARSDLNPKNGTYPFAMLGHRSHGGIDMKVTSPKLFYSDLSFVAIGGPTYDSVPAFQWSRSDFCVDTPHLGQPDLWRFEPIVFGPAEVRPFGPQ